MWHTGRQRLCEDQPEEKREREGEPLTQSLRPLRLAAHRGAEIAEWAVEDKVESRVFCEIGKTEMGEGLEVNRELDTPR